MGQYKDQNIETSRLQVYEVFLGVDEVEVDDSYFQVGLTEREE